MNVVRELSCMKARLTLPGCAPSEYFDFLRGGKEGGVDTPDIFAAVMEYILEPCVQEWHKSGAGFKCTANDTLFVNRIVWADNLFLNSHSADEMQQMIHSLTSNIYSRNV